MKKQVTSEEFYEKIGPLNVMLEIKEPKNLLLVDFPTHTQHCFS